MVHDLTKLHFLVRKNIKTSYIYDAAVFLREIYPIFMLNAITIVVVHCCIQNMS